MKKYFQKTDISDKWIFGVCGGVADYFNLDSDVVRSLAAISVVLGGIGIIPYIILAVVMADEADVSGR